MPIFTIWCMSIELDIQYCLSYTFSQLKGIQPIFNSGHISTCPSRNEYNRMSTISEFKEAI